MAEDKIGAEEEEQVDDSNDDDEAEYDGQHEHNEERRKKKKRKTREEEPPGRSYGKEFDGSGNSGCTAAEKLKHSLLSKDIANVGQPLEDIAADIGKEEKKHVVDNDDYALRQRDRIWEVDIPERMQIYEERTGHPPTDESNIKIEADWIYTELYSGMMPLFSVATTEEVDDKMKRDIARFLKLMHVQKLDVPYIARYCKEEILSLLEDPIKSEDVFENYPNQISKLKWHEMLWTILDLDQKWLLQKKRKTALHLCYAKRFQEESTGIDNETRLKLNEQIFEPITESLEAAHSEREVDDVELKFNLHFPLGEVTQDERLKGESHYRVCCTAGLSKVASKLGCRSENFGSQISLKMRVHELEDAKEMPEEMASNFTCAMFETPEDVLEGARHMAAFEISCEPCIRKHVRRIFMDNVVVSTTPTSNGITSIDCLCLREKPLSKFEDAQWLLIQKAEEENQLQVTIELPEVVLDKLISELNDFYLGDGVGECAQSWNEQRKLILNDAIHNFLLPSMEKESRLLLTSRAKTWVRREYGKLLWDKVSIAPVKWKEFEGDDVYGDVTPSVMACCWGPGNPATTFVMLDSFGKVLDVQQAGSLQQFIIDHKPHCVVLGAANLSCRRLKNEILEGISKMVIDNLDVQQADSMQQLTIDRKPRCFSLGSCRRLKNEVEGISNMVKDNHRIVRFFYGDESLSRLYESSRVSDEQLPSREGIIRRAVALGRYYQNPLAMVATLCGPAREILSWELTSFENFLTPDEKYAMVKQVMVNVTNQVGLDIHLACRNEWLLAPLQFVSGLGPVKAASLQRSLIELGSFHSREDLRTRHGLGDDVFNNAVGFLPVLPRTYSNCLDGTRIHPKLYDLARDLAKSIVRKYTHACDCVAEVAIGHVTDKPYFLRAVDVREYAREKKLLDKEVTLNDMILELTEGYQYRRRRFAPLSLDDEFYMLTGESKKSLFEGKIVQATVRKVSRKTGRVFCVLESGLTGVLCKEDYPDNLSDKPRAGDNLTCEIKSIQKERYLVILTRKD